jgi:hypothetical protein
LGDDNDHERKTSRGLDSRGSGVRFPVSPFFELHGLRVSEGRRVQHPSSAGIGETCGGDLVYESFAVNQKAGPTRYPPASAVFFGCLEWFALFGF